MRDEYFWLSFQTAALIIAFIQTYRTNKRTGQNTAESSTDVTVLMSLTCLNVVILHKSCFTECERMSSVTSMTSVTVMFQANFTISWVILQAMTGFYSGLWKAGAFSVSIMTLVYTRGTQSAAWRANAALRLLGDLVHISRDSTLYSMFNDRQGSYWLHLTTSNSPISLLYCNKLHCWPSVQ